MCTECEMVSNCTSLWCNISPFAIEGVNLIDASILNSRLTYCVVQPFDSFQIILLLILTQPFIIICIQPMLLKALSLMFCNPIADAFYMLIRHTPYMSTYLSKDNYRRISFFLYQNSCGFNDREYRHCGGVEGGVRVKWRRPMERKIDLSAISATH